MRNSSYEWIVMNLGGFSTFATVQEMYLLNPGFNAVSTLMLKKDMSVLAFLFCFFHLSNSPMF